MSLNIGGTGSNKPYVKFNAKSDKWFKRGPETDIEISPPTFVIDFENIATGYLRFREGMAPERVMDPSRDIAAPSPGEGFKRGFVVMVFSPKFLDGVAEFASASLHLSNAIKDVFIQYDADKSTKPGLLPVVACTGSQAMKDKFGTNYRPTFKIVDWVPRPADLPNRDPIDPSEIWQGNASALKAAEPAKHVPPPSAKAAANPLEETLF